VIAVLLVIAAVVAVAILGTILLTRDDEAKVSQEDQVRSTIQDFDTAIQKGDLATLRSITCGDTAVSYVDYDDAKWKDIHAKVAAARQYPVVASIDEVVVNGTHAEANVTSFMAFDPATRSTRSFDLEFRDEQWKVCQAPQ
jgi:predicted secreted acid phosphatase